MIQKGLAFVFLFGIAPFCTGLIPARWIREERKKWITVYLGGFLWNLAVFQMLAVPVILKEPKGFEQIVPWYTALLILSSAAGLLCGFPWLKRMLGKDGGLISFIRNEKKERLPWDGILFWVLAAGLIAFQMYMAFAYASFDGDDAYYVVHSVLTDQTDTLYRIRPYTGLSTDVDVRHALAALPIWEAYVARMTGIHAAIVAHTLLPLLLIPLTYLLYYRIGSRIFKEDRMKVPMFLIFVSILQIWGNTSIYTNATFFLTRTWQGKSVLCNLVLLTAVWVLLELAEEDRLGWWLLLLANGFVAALTTTMGAFLAALFTGLAGLLLALHKKKPSLLWKVIGCCVPCGLYLLCFVLLAY